MPQNVSTGTSRRVLKLLVLPIRGDAGNVRIRLFSFIFSHFHAPMKMVVLPLEIEVIDNFQTRIRDPVMTCHSCISVSVGDVVIDTRAKRARIFEYRTDEYLSDVRTNIVHARRAHEYASDARANILHAQRAHEYPSDVLANILHAQRAYKYSQWYCRYWRTIFRYDNGVIGYDGSLSWLNMTMQNTDEALLRQAGHTEFCVSEVLEVCFGND